MSSNDNDAWLRSSVAYALDRPVHRLPAFAAMTRRLMAHRCPSCDAPLDPSSFHRREDRVEFRISGMCAACQGVFFSDEEATNESLGPAVSSYVMASRAKEGLTIVPA